MRKTTSLLRLFALSGPHRKICRLPRFAAYLHYEFEPGQRLAQDRPIIGATFGYLFDDEYLLAYQSRRTGEGDQCAAGPADEEG